MPDQEEMLRADDVFIGNGIAFFTTGISNRAILRDSKTFTEYYDFVLFFNYVRIN
jgi:hypothetical protein